MLGQHFLGREEHVLEPLSLILDSCGPLDVDGQRRDVAGQTAEAAAATVSIQSVLGVLGVPLQTVDAVADVLVGLLDVHLAPPNGAVHIADNVCVGIVGAHGCSDVVGGGHHYVAVILNR